MMLNRCGTQRSYVKFTLFNANFDLKGLKISELYLLFLSILKSSGMCECSTCHVIADQETFDKLPEPEEEELDVLDVALGVTDTSRLACQIDITRGIEGARFTVPDSFNDQR